MITKLGSSKIRAITDNPTDQHRWQTYVNHHPQATSYHTLAWRTIFEQSFGYRSWYLMAENPSTAQVEGCLPLFLVAAPFSRRLVAVPFRDRGGPLWSTPEAFMALINQAKHIATEVRASFLELKSLTPLPSEFVTQPQLQENFYWVNSRIDLQALDSEQFWQKIGPKTRNMIRQAEKKGLTCHDMTAEKQGVMVWYELHLATQQHLGLPPFPLKFFQTMLEELRPMNEVKLFVIKQHQQAVAATILLLQRNWQTGIYGYSSSDPASQTLRPNDFMLFHSIQWLIGQGFTIFDLGSDAPGQEGLLFFKKKWLAEQRTIPSYTWGRVNPTVADSSAPQYALLRHIFRYLPRSLLRLTGTLATKYFG